MKLLRRAFKGFLCLLLIPVAYLIIALVLTLTTVNSGGQSENTKRTIYLSTNGVHLDVILSKEDVNAMVLKDLRYYKKENYLSFGWGDENFYINTPTWGDLTFSNAFKAMFLKSSTLLHVTRYKQKQSDWVEIKVTDSELQKLNTYLLAAFKRDKAGNKQILPNKGYTPIDDFYKAEGSYTCFNTCNSWVNTAFKNSGLKACLWTPFDFGLMGKYD
ncbi:TIGR02117 family protein [Fulvivirga maritima]|uniref:TIGR02117 family protein n=1 Tax=Fulvivirga maritima TaxID=2904247 RepID=UPI001F3C9F8F|nr:TIGR02117 family protein [Fulvivirga maritima]UII24405.1 TIGR02117 family protein [Fulvivirga maritima]